MRAVIMSTPRDFDQLARPAQLQALEKIADCWAMRRGAFGMSCIGTGKTIVTLTALQRHRDQWKRVLVIAPPLVAATTWVDEPYQWRHTAKVFRPASTVGLTAAERRAVVEDEQLNLVTLSCAPAILKWFFTTYAPREVPFDVLVIDEADKFKDRSTQRFKVLSRRTFEFAFRIAQTGSPADEGLHELYAQAKLIQPDIWRGLSWTGFKSQFFEPVNPFNRYSKIKPRAGAREKIYEILEPITFRVAREDMGDMPERTIVTQPIHLPEALRRRYRGMEKDFVAELNTHDELPADANPELLPIGSVAALYSKLQQFCDGFLYDEEKKTHLIHQLKIDRAKDIANQLANDGKQVLIVYRFQATAHALGFPYIGGGVGQRERTRLIRQFQSGKIQALAVHPAAAGHGLNLQTGGCHHLLLVGVGASQRLYNQVTGRIDRKGQTHRVIEIRLVVPDSVDADVYTSLATKAAEARGVLDAMRQRVGLNT